MAENMRGAESAANRQRKFNIVLIAAALAIIGAAAVFYVGQLNRAISENIIGSVSEIAEHDKATIQTNIEFCWDDLYEIQERFVLYDCETIHDLEIRMNLERASSEFTHIYLLAEDGTIYTDRFVTYSPGSSLLNRDFEFFPYFEDGKERVVVRFDAKTNDGWIEKEHILYGVRLHDYEVEGVRMFALIGINDISFIQDHMVIDSFTCGFWSSSSMHSSIRWFKPIRPFNGVRISWLILDRNSLCDLSFSSARIVLCRLRIMINRMLTIVAILTASMDILIVVNAAVCSRKTSYSTDIMKYRSISSLRGMK